MLTCEITDGRDGRKWIKVSFRFAQIIVDRLKTIPEAHYNPYLRVWGVPLERRQEFERKCGTFLINWKDEALPNNGGISEDSIPDQPIVPGYSVEYNHEGKILNFKGFKKPPWGRFQVKGFNAMVERSFLILADEQGLGKSFMTVTAMEAKKKLGMLKRGLIVCRSSLLYNWRDEIADYTFQKSLVVAGPKAARFKIYDYAIRHKDEWMFMIVSYDTFRTDTDNLKYLDDVFSFDFMVVDEAQVIKNPQSQIGTKIHQIPARYKYLLTATPLPNTPLESYNYLKLGGKIDMNWWQFRNRYAIFGGYNRKEIICYINTEELRETLQSCMLRRLKKDKLKELPDVVFKTIKIPLTSKQRTAYRNIENEIYEELKELNVSNIKVAMTKLLRLQQVTDSLELIGAKPDKDNSSKINTLDDLLEELIENSGEKVIVFSKFKSMTDLLKSRYSKYNPAVIDGSVKVQGGFRQQQVYKFQRDDSCKLFIGCAPACREGLTLTAASHVIFVDLEWSWAYVEQAFSRAHRITQKSAVTVCFLVCKGTVDEYVLETVITKQDLAKLMIDKGIDKVLRKA